MARSFQNERFSLTVGDLDQRFAVDQIREGQLAVGYRRSKFLGVVYR